MLGVGGVISQSNQYSSWDWKLTLAIIINSLAVAAIVYGTIYLTNSEFDIRWTGLIVPAIITGSCFIAMIIKSVIDHKGPSPHLQNPSEQSPILEQPTKNKCQPLKKSPPTKAFPQPKRFEFQKIPTFRQIHELTKPQ